MRVPVALHFCQHLALSLLFAYFYFIYCSGVYWHLIGVLRWYSTDEQILNIFHVVTAYSHTYFEAVSVFNWVIYFIMSFISSLYNLIQVLLQMCSTYNTSHSLACIFYFPKNVFTIADVLNFLLSAAYYFFLSWFVLYMSCLRKLFLIQTCDDVFLYFF